MKKTSIIIIAMLILTILGTIAFFAITSAFNEPLCEDINIELNLFGNQ